MVTASDLRQRILASPFEPFRVHLIDGRHFDVHDPTWNLVGEPVCLIARLLEKFESEGASREARRFSAAVPPRSTSPWTASG